MKSWLKSKTLWFNVGAGLVWLILGTAQDAPISPELLAGIQTAGNLVLRFLTSQGVSFRPPSVDA